MKKIYKKMILILFIILSNFTSAVYAADSEQSISNKLYGFSYHNGLTNAGMYIAGWIRYGALAVAVGMLMIKGIKLFTSSPEGKADAKKELMPWAIGAIILFTMNMIINFFVYFAQHYINNITM